jgi:hypothetical protein
MSALANYPTLNPSQFSGNTSRFHDHPLSRDSQLLETVTGV